MTETPTEYRLLVYESFDSRNPFNDWLLKLKDQKARAIIRARLNRIQLGNFGDVKSVGEGVFELRIHYGPAYRIYFSKVNNKSILLLYAGDKSTQSKDIKLAQMFWKEYKYAGKKL